MPVQVQQPGRAVNLQAGSSGEASPSRPALGYLGSGQTLAALRIGWSDQPRLTDIILATVDSRRASFTSGDMGKLVLPAAAEAPGVAQARARAASGKLPGALTEQQERLEEVYSGALDGLSGADIAPAVEELENLGAKLGRALGDLGASLGDRLRSLTDRGSRAAAEASPKLDAVTNSAVSELAPGWIGAPLSASSSSDSDAAGGGGLPASKERHSAALQPLQTVLPAAPSASGSGLFTTPLWQQQQKQQVGVWPGAYDQGSRTKAFPQQQDGSGSATLLLRPVGLPITALPRILAVPADIGFSAAASNAVTTAVNVNSQLSGLLTPLRRAAADVRRVVGELAALTAALDSDAANGRGAEAVAKSAAALRAALGSASETVTGAGSGLPGLVDQLAEAVRALHAANDDGAGERGLGPNEPSGVVGRLLPKLEGAVGALREAAASSETEASLLAAEERVAALEGEGSAADVSAEAEAAAPALQAIEKAVSRLQTVLRELDAAVGAAKEVDLPNAPALRD